MIKVTGRVKEELKKLALSSGDKPGGVLRLVAGQLGRLQFVKDYDDDYSGDQVIRDGDEVILLVDNELSGSLNGITIDWQARSGGPCLRRDEG